MKMKMSLAVWTMCATLAAAPAIAQDTIGDITIPAEELESVRNHCETLAAADRADMGEAAQGQGDHEENPAAEGGEGENAAGQGNAEGNTALTEADDASPAETAGTIDFDAVTLDQCIEAGFAEQAAE